MIDRFGNIYVGARFFQRGQEASLIFYPAILSNRGRRTIRRTSTQDIAIIPPVAVESSSFEDGP